MVESEGVGLHVFQKVFDKIVAAYWDRIDPIRQGPSRGKLTRGWVSSMGYSRVFVGRGTYGRPEIIGVTREDLYIGSFVSISEGVVIVLANHNSSGVSLYPFSNVDWLKDTFLKIQNPDKHAVSKGPVVIGNDVWLGRNCIILAGVNIGDGAVIGAGAVVSRDVPPFAVVVGNPSRVVKFRLSDKQISEITAIGWWEWDSDVLKARETDFFLPPDEFISKFSKERKDT